MELKSTCQQVLWFIKLLVTKQILLFVCPVSHRIYAIHFLKFFQGSSQWTVLFPFKRSVKGLTPFYQGYDLL